MDMFEITKSSSNKDIPEGMGIRQAQEYYLALRGDFVSRLSPPVVEKYEDKWVFRGDLSQTSLKGYGAEQLIAGLKEDTVVYCAPRVGMAMDAIATLAKLYDKKCVFFCPASAKASVYQKALLDYGAELRFVKIAAMPTLNVFAKRWAEANGAKYLPFGLANTPSVTAGLVAFGRKVSSLIGGDPTQIWMSVSTGTAIRALEIAWPKTEVRGVVVARNMKDGEIGRAQLWSSDLPFLKDAPKANQPPFPSTPNYDSKCWTDFDTFAKPGSIFINVGADDKIQEMYRRVEHIQLVSQREWNDKKDLL